MLRIEAYTVLDGLALRVVGTCQGHCGTAMRCQGDGGQAMISSEEVEIWGESAAVIEAIRRLSLDIPGILQYVHH